MGRTGGGVTRRRISSCPTNTCAIHDRRSFYPSFVRMMRRYPNLYGDTAILETAPRFFALPRLSLAPHWLRLRIVHGSDYPFPPSRWAFLTRVGPAPAEPNNPLDLDLRIKRSFRFPEGYESPLLHWLRIPAPPPRPGPG